MNDFGGASIASGVSLTMSELNPNFLYDLVATTSHATSTEGGHGDKRFAVGSGSLLEGWIRTLSRTSAGDLYDHGDSHTAADAE